MSTVVVSERYVEAAGIKARVLEEGSGSPVLLLHGGSLGIAANIWQRNLGPLASLGLRAIAADLPGSGGTDHPLEFTEAYRRRFVLEVLDAVGVEHAGLVGHSNAGGLAVSLGFEHPERLSGVMVLGTHSLLPPLGPGEESLQGGAAAVGRSAKEPTIDDVRDELEELLVDRSLITPDLVQEVWQVSSGCGRVGPRWRNARIE